METLSELRDEFVTGAVDSSGGNELCNDVAKTFFLLKEEEKIRLTRLIPEEHITYFTALVQLTYDHAEQAKRIEAIHARYAG